MSREAQAEKTCRITDTVIHHPWFLDASDLYCYIDFNHEVGTAAMIEEAWRRKKRVWVPRVNGEEMEFFLLDSFADLHPGAYGIREPDSLKHPDTSDGFMIVPGVAFDRKRNRIGYGKGYYDRYLKMHPALRTAAVAFDLQIVDRIEAEEQDIRPDLLVTESGIYI